MRQIFVLDTCDIKTQREETRMSIMSKERYYQLAPDLTICRIVNGMWQVAGGHGYIDHKLAIEDMIRYHEAGFTSWDLADIMAQQKILLKSSGVNYWH